ncbi:hypothetical protein DRO49_03195 [Candidatus Bathyarchaeota archaeon]|nr:MAG: hypothetical protein DRO49_03195 [Candidatus Bathyarchaeota archaeon]
MIPERIYEGYLRLREKGFDAELSNTFHYLLIRNVPLPRKFNQPYTHILIENNPSSDYIPPNAYVERTLRIWDSYLGKYVRSTHLDESLTPQRMLDKGWVKLCYRINWNPSFSLIDFVIMVLRFLKDL